MRLRARTSYVVLLALVGSVAGAQTPPTAGLTPFGSDGELAHYLRQIADARTRYLAEQQREAARRAGASACAAGEARVVGRGTSPGSAAAVVRGRVRAPSGVGLAAANVLVPELDLSVGASERGDYRIAVPNERLSTSRDLVVRVRAIGFRPGVQLLSLSAGDSVELDFTLCQDQLQLSQVVVTGAATRADGDEAVTNTQHAGVDEGGIVKLHGRHLVVLRRGRLFTVDVRGRALRPVAAVDAFGPGIDPDAAWYDEMLVAGDRVVVIGYSYERGGTEVGVFHIDRAGRLRHQSTFQLRSDDYYSSRNYASRLVGDRLVFYTPLSLPDDEADPLAALPAMREWRGGRGRFERIASAQHVYRPVRPPSPSEQLALHTVTSCDLAARRVRCESTVVLGPDARTFYVSPSAVYLWATAAVPRLLAQHERRDAPAPAMVYRLPLAGSRPSALAVAGSPIDQFSFLESEDGHLNVLVRAKGAGDAMWNAERSRRDAGGMALLRVPLARFGDGSDAAASSHYRPLEGENDRAVHNRFVGAHLLYGTGNGWGEPRAGGAALHVVPLDGGAAARLTLPHGVDRIEVMGRDAVVVGSDGRDLHFSGIRLGARPAVMQRYAVRGASQGELRSHGFFYRAEDAESGVLGLPVRGPGRPGYEHLIESSASIVFVRNTGVRFVPLGTLHARDESAEDDDCRASCVDWYGNARPLFLRGRILALLGYELVEGTMRDGRVVEVRRVSFAPRRTDVARR